MINRSPEIREGSIRTKVAGILTVATLALTSCANGNSSGLTDSRSFNFDPHLEVDGSASGFSVTDCSKNEDSYAMDAGFFSRRPVEHVFTIGLIDSSVELQPTISDGVQVTRHEDGSMTILPLYGTAVEVERDFSKSVELMQFTTDQGHVVSVIPADLELNGDSPRVLVEC